MLCELRRSLEMAESVFRQDQEIRLGVPFLSRWVFMLIVV